jgi:DNA (cytosine-5)-methyltransferase 1
MRVLNKLSLFTGILGDDIASEWAGIKTICCVEIDPFCQQVIKKHHPDMPIIGDVRDVTKEKVKEVSGREWVDIISGGFPCQDVSTSGLRAGINENTRSGLWGEYARIISEFRPRWVVVENVRGLLSIDNGGGFGVVLRDLAGLGYDAFWCVLQASQLSLASKNQGIHCCQLLRLQTISGWASRCLR